MVTQSQLDAHVRERIQKELDLRHDYWNRRGLRGKRAVGPRNWAGTAEQLEAHNLNVIRNAVALIHDLISGFDFPILDVGCGYGRIAVNLAGMGHTQVTGIDFSEVMLGLAREYSAERDVFFPLMQGEASRLLKPDGLFEEGQFRLVIMGALNIHIVDPDLWRKSLQQAKTVLEDWGMLMIFEPMQEGNPQYGTLEEGMKQPFTRIRSQEDYRRELNGMAEVAFQLVPYCDEQYTFMVFQKPC